MKIIVEIDNVILYCPICEQQGQLVGPEELECPNCGNTDGLSLSLQPEEPLACRICGDQIQDLDKDNKTGRYKLDFSSLNILCDHCYSKALGPKIALRGQQ